MIDFLSMDGYGFYVWTSYAVAIIFLVVNVLWPLSKRRKVARDINARQRAKGRQTRRRTGNQMDAADREKKTPENS